MKLVKPVGINQLRLTISFIKLYTLTWHSIEVMESHYVINANMKFMERCYE